MEYSNIFATTSRPYDRQRRRQSQNKCPDGVFHVKQDRVKASRVVKYEGHERTFACEAKNGPANAQNIGALE